jgi:carboxymethylenebutenolidase
MKSLVGVVLALGIIQSASAQAHVKDRLDTSPRHHEWVDVKRGERTVRSFVTYPESDEKTLAVIVIHENKGLTDWVRSVADQLAEAGYLAIAPDLLSGHGPGGGNTDAFTTTDAATQAIYRLEQDEVTADLTAVADYVAKLPAASGKVVVAGFCWGGSQAFRFATERGDLGAAFVFYGSPPEETRALARIDCPVYGFYGENDARINATIPATTDVMKRLGKTYEPVTYQGAGHGFMRAGEGPDASDANRKARDEAWERWKKVLRTLP